MHIASTEIIAWLSQYMWPFIRIGAFVSVAPIYGTHTVPARIKIIITLALTVLVAPMLHEMQPVDPLSVGGVITAFQQVLIGATVGFLVTLLFDALITGGQVVAQLMGLGFASMMDPQNGVTVPVIGQLYTILATLIFLVLNGHLVLVDIMVTSFHTMPVGMEGMIYDKIWQVVIWGKWIFIAAVILVIPAITSLILINIAFGVLTRAAPQLNIFAVGFPITILLGFAVILVSLPYFIPKFQQLLDQLFTFIRHDIISAG